MNDGCVHWIKPTDWQCRRGAVLVLVAAALLCGVLAANAQGASSGDDVIFADGFDTSFTLSVLGTISIRQGGVITVEVAVAGDGFDNGRFGLHGAASLDLSASARLYGNGTGRLGYSFQSSSRYTGNLALYVGRGVAVGSYPLTVTAHAGDATHAASFTLQVLAKGTVREIWPTTPGGYQDALGDLLPGDVLVLHQGTYSGYKTVRASGTGEKPITIRGYGHGEAKPILAYTGASHNHWEIRGSHLIVQGLEFDTPNTYSIRIRPPASGGEVDNVTLVNLTFVGCGGGCISANDGGATYQDIRIIDSLVLDALRTPVYIGNHQGTATFHNFLFEGNVVDARSIVASDVVGYGIEVKLNVENAVVRNNVIVGARGPGIMTYGLAAGIDPAHRAIVEGNIVIGSCTDRNILIGAGPTIARRNLSLGGHSDGYGIYDYGNRHLSAGIQIIGNTALLNQPNGFWVTPNLNGTGLADLRMVDNLAYPSLGGSGFNHLPPDTASNDIEGNTTATATPAMATMVAQLQTIVPAPQALKPLWPQLARGPLQPAELTSLLSALASLPIQSANPNPRACP